MRYQGKEPLSSYSLAGIEYEGPSQEKQTSRVAWHGPPSPVDSTAASDSRDSPVIPISWTKSVLDLDNDSLYLVIVALCETVDDSKSSKAMVLAPLSLVCKRLRELILPLMFREGRTGARRRRRKNGRDPSRSRSLGRSSICRLFKTFEVDQDDPDDVDLDFGEAIRALSRMTNLTTLIITLSHLQSHALISAAAQLHSLTTLILNITRIDTPDPLPFGQSTNLEKVIIREGLWPMKRVETQRALERANVSSIILSNHLTLRYLEVPAEITDLFELGSLQWPRLDHFILNGYVAPRPHPSALHLLGNMSHLSALEFNFLGKGTWDDVRRSAFVLTEAEDLSSIDPLVGQRGSLSEAIINSSGSRLDELLPRLTSLSVSNVSPDDQFFHCLPPALESLSVMALPPDSRGGSWRAVVPLTEDRCVSLMTPLASLELKKLHITHEESVTTLSLIGQVANILPSVEVLVLEAAHYNPYSDTDLTDEYLIALEPLEMLQDLRISVPFHRAYTATDDDVEQIRENFAEQVASTHSELQCIGLRQYVAGGGRDSEEYPPFYVWWVVRDDDGSVIMEYDELTSDYP